MSKYSDPRWQKKRLEILERDQWTCQDCAATHETLHVHHLWYQHYDEPWMDPAEALLALCTDCHTFEHQLRKENEGQLLHSLRYAGFLGLDLFLLSEVVSTIPDTLRDLLEVVESPN